MEKVLAKGTKVEMIERMDVVIASEFGSFKVGEIGTIKECKGHIFNDDSLWYNVEFAKGDDVVPEVWFKVVEDTTVKLDKDTAEELSKVTGEKIEADDEVEVVTNVGATLTIQYDGDNLSIDSDVDMDDLSEKEVNMLYGIVDNLYSLLGIGVDD